MAKRPRNRVQPVEPSTFNLLNLQPLKPSTLAKRPRNRVQPAKPPTFNLQPVEPWPKGHAIAFNIKPLNKVPSP
ncbi:MAG: hypothetical protein F6J94_08775 [Moorea sp. SIO1F2]|uniref:hypothetical protein n=1 Tax=Moorena sp. SIO1F2 TaxID=2607819 RepID=UPI0013BABB4D|nr:hypothetical protein [Moorena sp. SIO1F2]NET82029.1 hypothetical protein [Moorena sp. SIO1F2]